jgi:hypothetical protein
MGHLARLLRLMISDDFTRLGLTKLGAKEKAFRSTIMIMTTIDIPKESTSCLTYQSSSPFRVIHTSVKLCKNACLMICPLILVPISQPVQNAIDLCQNLSGARNEDTQVALRRHYNIVAVPSPYPYTLLL